MPLLWLHLHWPYRRFQSWVWLFYFAYLHWLIYLCNFAVQFPGKCVSLLEYSSVFFVRPATVTQCHHQNFVFVPWPNHMLSKLNWFISVMCNEDERQRWANEMTNLVANAWWLHHSILVPVNFGPGKSALSLNSDPYLVHGDSLDMIAPNVSASDNIAHDL